VAVRIPYYRCSYADVQGKEQKQKKVLLRSVEERHALHQVIIGQALRHGKLPQSSPKRKDTNQPVPLCIRAYAASLVSQSPLRWSGNSHAIHMAV
jgi:hypothetical protein